MDCRLRIQGTIEPGQYLLVWCSGKDRINTPTSTTTTTGGLNVASFGVARQSSTCCGTPASAATDGSLHSISHEKPIPVMSSSSLPCGETGSPGDGTEESTRVFDFDSGRHTKSATMTALGRFSGLRRLRRDRHVSSRRSSSSVALRPFWFFTSRHAGASVVEGQLGAPRSQGPDRGGLRLLWSTIWGRWLFYCLDRSASGRRGFFDRLLGIISSE